MNIERMAGGRFAIVQGSKRLELAKSQYEDIFYALPLDTGTLFRLINDTVLGADPLRVVFRAMVAEAGGSESAMTELQESVKGVEPA
ncbi:MAG: hypothetical protein K8T20_13490 [Planctomycetes bacterium]|nr:hypothetical protein [Planctomycetota bacterium]